MFTFGSTQDEKDARKEAPAAAAWSQLVMSDEPAKKKSEAERSVYDRCSAITAGLRDEDAKDLLKALVFLTSRSNKI